MATSKYEYYKHRPLRSTAGLWFAAIASLLLGALIFFGLAADETNIEADKLQRLTLAVSIAISAICVIIASSYRWFHS